MVKVLIGEMAWPQRERDYAITFSLRVAALLELVRVLLAGGNRLPAPFKFPRSPHSAQQEALLACMGAERICRGERGASRRASSRHHGSQEKQG